MWYSNKYIKKRFRSIKRTLKEKRITRKIAKFQENVVNPTKKSSNSA